MKKKVKFLIVIPIMMSLFITLILSFSKKVDAYSYTREQLANKFNEIRNWDGYRHGEKYMWNDGYTSAYCNAGGHWAKQCHGYGLDIFNNLFQQCAMCSEQRFDMNNICVGDLIRFNNYPHGEHTVIVQDVVGDTVYYTDANGLGNGTVRWDQSESKAYFQERLLYIAHASGNEVRSLTEYEVPDTAPNITDILVDPFSITKDSVVVKAKATDDKGVTGIKFRVWRSGYTSDSGTTKWGTYNSSTGYYDVTFSKSDTKTDGEGLCCIEAWAYDEKGNESAKAYIYNFVFANKAPSLGNFTARIISKCDSNFCLGVEGGNNGDNLKLKKKNLSDISQLWKFEEQANGSYKITNLQSGKSFDTEGGADAVAEGTPMQVWQYDANAKQHHYILQEYNGGYRIIPGNSKEMKAIDIVGGDIYDNQPIWLYSAYEGTSTSAQTWTFKKIATSLKLSATTATAKVGGVISVSVYIDSKSANSNNISVTSSNPSVATVAYNGVNLVINGKKEGTTVITVKTKDGSNLTKTCTVTVKEPEKANILYSTHVQEEGWQTYKSNGTSAGTTGKSYRLEGIKIKLDSTYSGSVQYRTHVQEEGWQGWVSNDVLSGTTGKSYRLEAIQIKLIGTIANYYDVYYRVHAQEFGWLGWAKNGASAGTEGFGYRLEAIQIKLVKKGGSAPGSTANAFHSLPRIKYTTHVQDKGWLAEVKDGTTSGTVGKGLRVEGLKMTIENGLGGSIQYRAHVQNQGWQNYVSNGQLAGTQGKGLRIEAIQMKLTGEMAKHFDIYYRVHVQEFGWLDWAKNGASAGTSGYGYRLEGIQVKLVRKGFTPPTPAKTPFRSK